MLILHGSWVAANSTDKYEASSFLIWAEWSNKYEDWEEGIFSRPKKRQRLHPFAASQPVMLASWPFFLQHSTLADLLRLYKNLEDNRWIWLPTDKYGPLASPLLYSKLQNTDLLYDADLAPDDAWQGESWVQNQLDEEVPWRYPAEARMKPWRVPGVELTALGAWQFLLAIQPEKPLQLIPETVAALAFDENLLGTEYRQKLWQEFLGKQHQDFSQTSSGSLAKKTGGRNTEWLGLEKIEDGFYLLDDVILADDLLYWQRLALLVHEMIVRQEYLPGLSVPDAKLDNNRLLNSKPVHSAWIPVLQRKQLQQALLQAAAAMPHVNRAIDPHRGEDDIRVPRKAAAMNAGWLVNDFVTSLLDAGVRYLSPPPLSRVQSNHLPERQWINALLSEKNQAINSINPKHLKRFAELQSWAEYCQHASQAKLQLGLRLESRECSSDYPWQLNVFLQDEEDLSLLIPADLIWSDEGQKLALLAPGQQNMQDYFLRQLGSAARIYPPLHRAMLTSCPQAAPLSPEEAYGLIHESASQLEIAGFRVMLPSFLSNFSLKIKLKSPRQKKKTSINNQEPMGLNTLLDFDWQLSVGDQNLNENEFRELVSLKQPLVNLRGQWVEMNAEEIIALQELWKRQQKKGQISLMDVLRSGIPLQADSDEYRISDKQASIMGMPVSAIDIEGWLKESLVCLQDNSRLELLPQPQSFVGELRPYQQRGYSWLKFLTDQGMGACLADDMGLGKTIQCLAFLLFHFEEAFKPGPVLLLCPTSVVGNWQREAKRFAPTLNCLVHHGGARLNGEDFAQAVASQQLIISSYSLLNRDYEMLQKVSWQGIILDEAQNIKNPDTQQARAAKNLPVDGFRIAMTGTPIENRLQELWSIMDFLNPGYLGSQGSFNKTYAVPIERYHDQELSLRLGRVVAPFILRRKKSDPGIVPELPDKLENKIYCNLLKEQASLYEAVVQETLSALDDSQGMSRRGLVLSTLLKLKQCCNHPALLLKDHSPLPGRSGKLNRLEEMLEEIIGQGEKALIFTQYAQWAILLQEYLQKKLGQEVICLHGGTPRLAREQMVQRFQEEKTPAIFILSVKAGGVGINLTRASHVFHYDRWWNPAVEEQASDRAYRIGQIHNVEVHKFICAGTLEEKIDALIERKRALGSEVIGSGEEQLTELSTEELREIFSLNWSEVGED